MEREQDRAALIALYDSAGGSNWTNSANWKSDEAIFEWHGVGADENGNVTLLNLSSNNLSGSMPGKLGDLSHLRLLNLKGNKLSGSIPAQLGKLSYLFLLELKNNELSGDIPSELGNLGSLSTVSLSGNSLTGCVPSGLRGVTVNDFDALDLPCCK